MTWTPGDPWPTDTPGGVVGWSGYVKLWFLVEIAPGSPWTMGPDPNDQLDAGNVLTDAGSLAGGGPTPPGTLPTVDGLWVDLTCDLVQLEWAGGAGSPKGVLSTTDAGTLTATLWDPTGKYDPFNPDSPFALGTLNRLAAGARVVVFTEIMHDPDIPVVFTRFHFAGTVDTWSEPWTKYPADRTASIVATDLWKDLNKLDRPEQPPVGAGDTVFARLNRLATYYGFPAPTSFGSLSARTLAATTLAQPALELLQRATTDDLGFVFGRPNGLGETGIVFVSGVEWQHRSDDPVTFKIGNNDPDAYDIVTSAVPSARDKDLLNTVTASNSGGTEQTATNVTSVDAYGERSYKRTDLGLQNDTLAAGWAGDLVSLSAFPRIAVDELHIEPKVGVPPWTCFERIMDQSPVISLIDVRFRSPEFSYEVDTLARLVGWTHTVTKDDWSTVWRTVGANMASGGQPWTLGPHTFDRLDAGNVLT